ncbi:hypothetical protein [Desulfosarcina ovata]|uniref:hypothetical protein n=1 Tax=Desulfosarcina ovata TaxID=83564 RepID=UPI0012D2F828|nr:hypothetical protein [Desulfosarcina ovata]
MPEEMETGEILERPGQSHENPAHPGIFFSANRLKAALLLSIHPERVWRLASAEPFSYGGSAEAVGPSVDSTHAVSCWGVGGCVGIGIFA